MMFGTTKMMTTTTVVLLTLSSFVVSTFANFLPSPFLQWSTTLPQLQLSDDLLLQRGNAVVVSDDDVLLFVTTRDGRLFILSTTNGLPITDAYQPQPLQDSPSTGTIICESGVALATAQDELDSGGDSSVQFAVYAVIDTPNDDSTIGTVTTSRIIAINADGSERWTVPLEGRVVGTPVIGVDQKTIYVSHNVPNDDVVDVVDDNGEPLRGAITVLRDENNDGGGGPYPVVLAARVVRENRFGPFGPLVVQSSTGANGEGESDVVFVAESWEGGYTNSNGNVYFMDTSTGSFTLQLFSEWGRSSLAAPTVSVGADKLWMGGRGAYVAGWIGNDSSSLLTSGDVSRAPTWQFSFMQENERNVTMRTSPVVSTDGSLLFITGESDELYCVLPDSGIIQWAHDGGESDDNIYVAKPVFLGGGINNDDVLFTAMNSPDGDIQQLETQSGRQLWRFGCEELTGDRRCDDSIQAEFSISTSGNTLYYGNSQGTIVALQVGTFETPSPVTAPPTLAPTVMATVTPEVLPVPSNEPPTAAPNDAIPTASPTTPPTNVNAAPSDLNVNTSVQAPSGPNDKTSKALFGISALVAVLAIAVLAYVFVSHRRRKRRNRSALPLNDKWTQNDSSRDGGVDTGVPTNGLGGNSEGKRKKSLELESTSPRLAAIVEAPEALSEDESFEEGVELVRDDGDDADIAKYVFSYGETTPDTSLSSDQSSSNDPPSPDESARAASATAVRNALSPVPDVGKSMSSSSNGNDYDSEGGDVESPNNTELVSFVSNGPRPYYMLDTSPERAGSVIEVNKEKENDRNVERSWESEPVKAGSVNRASRSTFAAKPSSAVTSRGSAQSNGTLSPVSVENTVTQANGVMVPVYHSPSHPPSLSEVVPYSRERSDLTSSTVYIEDEKEAASESTMVTDEQQMLRAGVPMSAQLANTASSRFEPVSVRNDQSMQAFNMLEGQLSPCASMYIEEESITGATDDGTYASAPMDERASRGRPSRSKTPKRVNTSRPISPTSTISPAPKESHDDASANHAATRRHVSSPTTVEKTDDAYKADKKPPAYVFKAPLSPGSTIATTSVYIDDEGSVEMERDDETDISFPHEKLGPASVTLDACSSFSKTKNVSQKDVEETEKVIASNARSDFGRMLPSSSAQAGTFTPRKGDSSLLSSAPRLCPPPPLSPTSTSTNDSSTTTESVTPSPTLEARNSVRSLRKQRLERTVRDRKSRSPSSGNRETKTHLLENRNSPSSSSDSRERPSPSPESLKSRRSSTASRKTQRRSSEKEQATRTRGHVDNAAPKVTLPMKYSSQEAGLSTFDYHSHTTGDRTIASNSPRTPSTRGSDPMEGVAPTSSESEASREERFVPRVERKIRGENSRRSGRSSSYSSDDARETKSAKKQNDSKPAVISSYLSGLMKHVEEAERQFFNPTLPQKKTKTKKVTNGSRQSKEYETYSSDDDSLPPPPPKYAR